MPTLPILDRGVVVLAGIGMAAGAAMALAGILSVPKPVAAIIPPLPPAAAVHGQPATQPLAEPGEAVRRPPFSQSRRPPPPKPVVPPPPVLIPAPDLQVTGIIAGVSNGIATGMDKRVQKPFRLRTGDALGEWRVEAITRTSLRLRHEGQVQDFPLVIPPPITPAPPPR
ncbi:hypothetical protein [Azospirillum sp. B4]|uniref:hypothetical protein n=1 Tax=Azospirillum sp. B4 TaxID=95605 RepID=UPI000678EB63|nr:hypothetical protein [Azospirillum sp. B4]